jgi:hypothetical protein
MLCPEVYIPVLSIAYVDFAQLWFGTTLRDPSKEPVKGNQ